MSHLNIGYSPDHSIDHHDLDSVVVGLAGSVDGWTTNHGERFQGLLAVANDSDTRAWVVDYQNQRGRGLAFGITVKPDMEDRAKTSLLSIADCGAVSVFGPFRERGTSTFLMIGERLA
jgi:hypothetical protein